MKKFVSGFDFTPIAFVASMAVLLSTVALTTIRAFADSGVTIYLRL